MYVTTVNRIQSDQLGRNSENAAVPRDLILMSMITKTYFLAGY